METIEDFKKFVINSGYDHITTVSVIGIIDDYKSSIEASHEARTIDNNECQIKLCSECGVNDVDELDKCSDCLLDDFM